MASASASSASLEREFKRACDQAKALTKRPTDDELLGLYGLYKQATFGDCHDSRPFALNVKACAKHDAWMSLRGVNRERAKRSYIGFVKNLLRHA